MGHIRSLVASRSAHIERPEAERKLPDRQPGDGGRLPPNERMFRILAGSIAVGGLSVVAAGFGDAAGYVSSSVKIASDLHSLATPIGIVAAQTLQNHWTLVGTLIGGAFGAGKALGIEGIRNCLKSGLTGKESPLFEF